MWQEKIKQLASDNLSVLGVVQEQHSERTRLYKQWKQYDFPIAQDSITQLGLAVVPIFIGIDEHGIVRETRIRPDGLEAFLGKSYDAPEQPAPTIELEEKHSTTIPQDGTAAELCKWGDYELLFRPQEDSSHDNAVEAYKAALELEPDNGTIMFRLGVAYRQRYDEHSQADDDFDLASEFWTKALASNPRQYIWRRRIEQYGPRLEKPYPFYDWVSTAITEIEERGEQPVELTVKLTQSELADRPRRNKGTAQEPNALEMPSGTEELDRDDGTFVEVETTLVPGFVSPGKSATVHMRMVPTGAKWNNESTPLTVWIESDNASLSKQLLNFENPNQAESNEVRPLEFDILVKKGVGECTVKGFALYNVCQEDGVCMYRRQDFEIPITLTGSGERQKVQNK